MGILLVENHALFAATVVERFFAAHEVTVESTAMDAQAALANAIFDVVLVDYDLDDGKGDTLVRSIKGMSPPVPKIIGISARPTGNEALLAAGADAVCSKLRFGEVVGLLDSLMDGVEARRC